ncbi:MAG: discoidin domain-containing protein, partial [Candidatus Nitrosocosmicus sp.]
SGPSGLGYALIYDAHNKKWNNKGGNSFEEYTKLTQRYLERSGLRVITVWDQINENQMNMYTNNCRYLYGVTQQDWQKQQGKIPVYVKQNKLAFIPNYPCYTNNVENIIDMNEEAIAEFDGSHPIFITSQAVAWKVGPDSIIALKKKLEKLSPGNIVICRADHFFALYNEANRLSYNLTLSAEMKITTSPSSTPPEFVSDGTCSLRRSWISSKKGKKWIQFDFKRVYSLNRYVIRHAGVSGMDKSYNIKAFNLESSMDGKNWRKVDEQSNNKLDVTDIDFSAVEARYLRINIIDSGKDKVARIADVEVYGAVL